MYILSRAPDISFVPLCESSNDFIVSSLVNVER